MTGSSSLKRLISTMHKETEGIEIPIAIAMVFMLMGTILSIRLVNACSM